MGAEGTKLDEDFVKMEKVRECDIPGGDRWFVTLTDPPLCAVLLFQSVEVINTLLTELLSKTTEFLQPNPGSPRRLEELSSLPVPSADPPPLCPCVCLTADRAKLSVLSTMSRLRGREKPVCYPQTEGMLGDCMLHFGHQLGAPSEFGWKPLWNR